MLAEVERHGHFTVGLVPKETLWLDDSAHFAVHDLVIAPLLGIASECWAYGLQPDSEVFAVAKNIVEPKQGKWRVRSSGNPVRGRELFWNASSGKRGSIVITVPSDQVEKLSIFQHCRNVWVFGNLGAGHTPSALRYAKAQAKSADVILFMLSRNNGIEWLDILAAPSLAVKLYLRACDEVERTW